MRSDLWTAMFVAMACFFAATIAPLRAEAETSNCTEITSLPITITTQGTYCLKQNLNVNLTTGNAITVNTGNVTIEFNGWRVNNQADLAANGATGVYAENRKNITLRNGFIRGFLRGINLNEVVANASSANLVEDMKVVDCRLLGIGVEGDGSVIRNNLILNIGVSGYPFGYGISFAYADDGAILGNMVSNIHGTGTHEGIQIVDSPRVVVKGNLLRKVHGGTNYGISFRNSDDVVIGGNILLNEAGTGAFGILDPNNDSENISCLDNEVGGYVDAIPGCDVDNGNRVLFN